MRTFLFPLVLAAAAATAPSQPRTPAELTSRQREVENVVLQQDQRIRVLESELQRVRADLDQLRQLLAEMQIIRLVPEGAAAPEYDQALTPREKEI